MEQLSKAGHIKPTFWDFSRGFSVHGDIQAVFDAEPPQEIEDEIEGMDDLNSHNLQRTFAQDFGAPAVAGAEEDKGKDGEDKGKDGPDDARPGLKRTQTNKSMKSRRDSVMPFVGMSQRMRDLLNEDSDEEDGDSVKGRLEALERSTSRIEDMLGRLCSDLDDVPKRRSSSVSMTGGVTGTLQDLDRSGTTDLDD